MATETYSETRDSSLDYPETPLPGLALQVDFKWSAFKNIVSEKTNSGLQPLYIQHFGYFRHLRFENATTKQLISTGKINCVSIASECTIRGQKIPIKPLKKWTTKYNYMSTALSLTGNPIPITWVANSTLKRWNFVCLDAERQVPIAKLAVNWWGVKEIGNFYFEKSAEEVTVEMRDEVVTTGLTLLYVMVTRINNPLNLIGSVFGKTEKVEADGKDTKGANGIELGSVGETLDSVKVDGEVVKGAGGVEEGSVRKRK